MCIQSQLLRLGCPDITISEVEKLKEEYELFNVIGKGGFSKVLLARHCLTRTFVAIKILKKKRQTLKLILSEINIMKSICHTNVIKLFQVINMTKYVCLVMEMASRGTLLKHINRAGYLEEREACQIFKEIVCGLLYCHTLGVVHSDLKPENILRDINGRIKLSDFGLSLRFKEGQEILSHGYTIDYSAPELFTCTYHDGPKSDVWSLGIILYIMVTGTHPFRAKTIREIKMKIIAGMYEKPLHLSEELQDVLSKLLEIEPSKRPTLEAILQHPWLSQVEYLPPPSNELDSENLDPTIIENMCHMGFKPADIQASLSNRKFDSGMATYLIIQHTMHRKEKLIIQDQPPKPGATSSLASIKPPTVVQPRKRRASDPSFYPHLEKTQATGNLPTCPQNDKRASLPPISLHTPEKMPSVSKAPQQSPAVSMAPCKDSRGEKSKMISHAEEVERHHMGQSHETMKGLKRIRRRFMCFGCIPGRRSNRIAPMEVMKD